jgi:[acyl-carrier-protein] S-malonyltransferase
LSTAFLFPGQGTQHVGMGKTLAANVPEARAVFDQADDLLGFPLSTLCFSGPEADLVDTVNQQPAIFTTSMAVLRTLQARLDWQPPQYVAGHSMGEISALVAAGALDFAAGLRLARRRGELMAQAGAAHPGGMAAILALDIPTVTDLCTAAAAETGQIVQVANDNCPGQVVISGDGMAVEAAMAAAMNAGARKVVRLPISIAAHSPLMGSVTEAFAAFVDTLPLQPAQIPIVGNVSATLLTRPEEIRRELHAQLTAGVAWTASMQLLLQHGVDTFVEIGPGDTLLSFMKRIQRKAKRVKPELFD